MIKYKLFSQFCQRLGWKGGNGMHDVLPIVMSGPDKIPQFFELPREIVKTIKITHPTLVSLISTNQKRYRFQIITQDSRHRRAWNGVVCPARRFCQAL